jgi:hypothetical protein
MRTPVFLALSAALALTACPRQNPTPEPAVVEADEPFPSAPPPESVDLEFSSEMQVHFGQALLAHAAVVAGDLEAATAAHAELRDAKAYHVPEPWKPLMADVKAAASEGAEAEALVESAKAVATIGRACGECHAATEGGPDLSASTPPQAWTPESDMLQHQWAANQMWLGLTAPSAELWAAGAAALSETAHIGSTALPEDAAPRFADVESRVHAAAALAKEATDPDEQAERYAEILALCATCHAILRPE